MPDNPYTIVRTLRHVWLNGVLNYPRINLSCKLAICAVLDFTKFGVLRLNPLIFDCLVSHLSTSPVYENPSIPYTYVYVETGKVTYFM